MSIKPWDGREEAIAYLFHEDPDAVLVLQHNISDDTIASARLINKNVQRMVLDAKTKASWRAEEIIYEELVASRKSHFMPRTNFPDTEIAQRLILCCLRTGKYTPQAWLIRAMTERIQFRLLNGVEEDENDFALRLARNIFWKDT